MRSDNLPAFITIEPEVIGAKDGAEGELSIGTIYSSGNTDNQAVSLSAKAQHDSRAPLIFFLTKTRNKKTQSQ